MRIDLSEEQTFFQETVRRFVETETPVSRVREIAETPDGFDHDWWRQASCLGGGSTEMARNIISERILRMPGSMQPTGILLSAMSGVAGMSEMSCACFG
jgi:alkylation response protein AidB-like acyl-CoA dehydrogenase